MTVPANPTQQANIMIVIGTEIKREREKTQQKHANVCLFVLVQGQSIKQIRLRPADRGRDTDAQ